MLVVPVTIVLGLVLSLAEFVVVRRWERDEIAAALDRDAAVMIDAVQSVIRDDLAALRAIGAHYSADREVDRGEFRESADLLLSQFRGIQALAWVPRVRAADRAAFEESARREGDEGFRITEQATPGGLVPAGRRDEHFPVRFVEPLEGNQAALGFDTASCPIRLETLGRARDTGHIAASGRVALVHEGGGLPGFLVVLPIYHKGARLDSVEGRRANLEGFVLGAFRIDTLVESALSDLESRGIDLALYDTAAPKENRLLVARASHTRTPSDAAPAVSETNLGSGPRSARTLDVAGRQWLAVAAPAPAYAAARGTYSSWEVLGLGLAVTGALAAYLVTSCRRGVRIEALAADLLESNRRLEDARAATEQANRKLEQLATTDELTSLWNRRHFLHVLERECLRAGRSGTPLALAMLDLDHFKAINDTYGHALGDRVLAEVAAVMKSDARATDVVARYGGEEFMILMPDTSADEALIAAERIRRRVADHVVSNGPTPIRITVSIGISATDGGGGAEAERLVRQADETLYAAKQAGRNCTRFWREVLPTGALKEAPAGGP